VAEAPDMQAVADAPPSTSDAAAYWEQHAAPLQVYRDSAQAPYRDWVLEALQRDCPQAVTVLEVGCHCGPLLSRLTAAGYTASGVDVNAEVVAAAVADGHTASVAAIPWDLMAMGTRQFDVVVSSFCLAYISPEDLPATLLQLLRIARCGLVLVEPHAGPGVPSDSWVDGGHVGWRHEYLDALDIAIPAVRPPLSVVMSRYRKPNTEHLNGVVVARTTWQEG